MKALKHLVKYLARLRCCLTSHNWEVIDGHVMDDCTFADVVCTKCGLCKVVVKGN
jgi:hypothetical protein